MGVINQLITIRIVKSWVCKMMMFIFWMGIPPLEVIHRGVPGPSSPSLEEFLQPCLSTGGLYIILGVYVSVVEYDDWQISETRFYIVFFRSLLCHWRFRHSGLMIWFILRQATLVPHLQQAHDLQMDWIGAPFHYQIRWPEGATWLSIILQ